MATMKWSGIDEYLEQLERIKDPREEIEEAVYKGASVVADAMRAQINALPVKNQYTPEGERASGITSVQKKGLQDGFGVAKIRKDGDFYNAKLGFDGYNGQKTHKYPNGQPNSVIARSVCSGTSFRAANDFVGRATRSTKAQAEKAIKDTFEEALAKEFK